MRFRRHGPARHGRTGLALLASIAVLAAAIGTLAGPAHAASGPITLPDLKILVPADLISIGSDTSTGDRQLRFTHITADVGSGPFEIDPNYNSSTGVATFVQSIYRSPSAGQWAFDHTVPVAATGEWHPPSDYQFPLTSFTLNRDAGSGRLGPAVAVSPKSDYCITGDTMIDGVSNTPNETFIAAGNCGDPTQPLGWSVGWGDEYDQTDAGQPIDLHGVADGTYILHAVVDPRHVLTESNSANDVTDTLLRISADSVTVLAQSTPGTSLPTVTLSSPRSGSLVSGAVNLQASARATPPAVVRSLQFLLDGQPIGPALRAAPYTYTWAVAGTRPGKHWLSAEVTDSNGNLSTARSVQVIVRRPPHLRVLMAHWRHGLLTIRLARVPRRGTVRATLQLQGGHLRMFSFHRRLRVHVPRPQTVTLTVLVAGRQVGGELTLRLGEWPVIRITNPVRGETVSGVVPVSAIASGGNPVAYVQFSLDGHKLGRRLPGVSYRLIWDTRSSRRGRHTLTARVLDVSGAGAVARTRVIVRNPAPPMTCFVMQKRVSVRGEGALVTPAFHTAMKGETLLVFVSADGPQANRAQSATVSGAGLSWRLVRRANAGYGDSEIWSATARSVLSAAQVSSTLSQPSYSQSLSVVAMEGTDGVGASAAAAGSESPPELSLRTLSRTSLVFAVGNDWSAAAARTLPSGWVMLDQWLNAGSGDTFWSQYTNQPTGAAHRNVHVGSGAPAGDRWNLAAVELVGSRD